MQRIACSLLFASLFTAQLFAAPAKFSVLFIAVDDLRPELGCYGNKIVKTPNLDRLAAEGSRLTSFYVAQAVCTASRAALKKAGWNVGDVDLIEANEAFAAQAIAVNKDLGWDTNKVNVNGGAIAIGHPIGASGARVLVTLLHEMQKRDAKKGIASLCIGGGMGVSLTVER